MGSLRVTGAPDRQPKRPTGAQRKATSRARTRLHAWGTDFNDDGDPDLAVGNFQTIDVSILLGIPAP
jgi:hypothetical protein